MKKLLIIVSVLTILTGCSSDPVSKTKLSIDDSPVQNSNINTTSEKEISSNTITSSPTISDFDQVAYNGAMELKDNSYCEKISNVTFKQKCLDDLNISKADSINSASNLDCSALSNPKDKEVCLLKKQVAEDLAKKAISEQQEIEKTNNLESQIVKSGELSKCKSLDLKERIYNCEMNILLPQVYASKDLKICQQASTPETVKACESSAVFK